MTHRLLAPLYNISPPLSRMCTVVCALDTIFTTMLQSSAHNYGFIMTYMWSGVFGRIGRTFRECIICDSVNWLNAL